MTKASAPGQRPRGRRGRLVAALCASVLGASACISSASGGGNASATSFAELDPIVLRVPTLYGPGHYQTRALEEYGAAVEKASDGKVSFEFFYLDSLVEPADTTKALADGIVDVSLVVPGYTPSDFPIDVWTSDLAFQSSSRPVVGALQSTAAVLDWSFNQPEMLAEYDRLGLVPLLPRFTGHVSYNLLCTKPVTSLREARGMRGRVGGPNWAKEIEALGMTSVSLAGGEIYEGFQRGIIDCYVGSGPDMVATGLWDVGKHYTELGLSGWSSGGLMVGKTTWERLPLIVRQVLFDQSTVYLESWHRGWIEGMREFVVQGQKRGVQFHEPDESMRGALEKFHQRVLGTAQRRAPEGVSAPGEFLDAYSAAHDRWLGIVTGELGYEPRGTTWAEWARGGDTEIDLGPWIERIRERILAPHRPQ
ncbi:C4-dicarboxylate TRAP transporter substrate-binding protein [Prauserella muralis]|uniref:C4-dicarboxylate TRAP transporter substrate-binding protein n=1 Tax=Prauserella muralis TaxID=588067 RepID=UPI0011ADAAFD|nr:C4-dicarboxylate TRAP transporter substrate-binding protein [Prauserella muralis]TWE22565.1 TRAP-type C4-dicarboxylate transport system substrate-binding protein [Prauserella muralis]